MGENVMRGQCEAFQKRSDRAMDLSELMTMFERPEVVLTNYNAPRVGSENVELGDVLQVHVAIDGKTVCVAKKGRNVAEITGDGARQLVETLEGSLCPDFSLMKVIGYSEIGEFFTLRLFDPGNHDG